ncbi:hypothetical protein [Arthrobacter alpinus]|uniref:hypothetical protein n=1 Tax=Arthrobacter alpinus TaxID=656366 RepID=UPI000A866868|nr:hypothetical protein [Arthrobacter alpinus]
MSSPVIMDEKGIPFEQLQFEQIEGITSGFGPQSVSSTRLPCPTATATSPQHQP